MAKINFKDALTATVIAPLAILWIFGSFIGAIIEALDKDLIGVVMSIFIPFYGAIVTVATIFEFLFK